MPGEGLQIPDGLAALGEQGEAAMPQVVEAERGQLRPFQERLVVAVHYVLCVQRLTLPGREDEPVILV